MALRSDGSSMLTNLDGAVAREAALRCERAQRLQVVAQRLGDGPVRPLVGGCVASLVRRGNAGVRERGVVIGIALASRGIGETCDRGLAQVLRDADPQARTFLLQGSPEIRTEPQGRLVHFAVEQLR